MGWRLCPNHYTISPAAAQRKEGPALLGEREESGRGEWKLLEGARYQKMHRHSPGKYSREEPPL